MISIASFIGILLTLIAISIVSSVVITVLITGDNFSIEDFWIGLLTVLLIYIAAISFYITVHELQKYENTITVTVSENGGE